MHSVRCGLTLGMSSIQRGHVLLGGRGGSWELVWAARGAWITSGNEGLVRVGRREVMAPRWCTARQQMRETKIQVCKGGLLLAGPLGRAFKVVDLGTVLGRSSKSWSSNVRLVRTRSSLVSTMV